MKQRYQIKSIASAQSFSLHPILNTTPNVSSFSFISYNQTKTTLLLPLRLNQWFFIQLYFVRREQAAQSPLWLMSISQRYNFLLIFQSLSEGVSMNLGQIRQLIGKGTDIVRISYILMRELCSLGFPCQKMSSMMESETVNFLGVYPLSGYAILSDILSRQLGSLILKACKKLVSPFWKLFKVITTASCSQLTSTLYQFSKSWISTALLLKEHSLYLALVSFYALLWLRLGLISKCFFYCCNRSLDGEPCCSSLMQTCVPLGMLNGCAFQTSCSHFFLLNLLVCINWGRCWLRDGSRRSWWKAVICLCRRDCQLFNLVIFSWRSWMSWAWG